MGLSLELLTGRYLLDSGVQLRTKSSCVLLCAKPALSPEFRVYDKHLFLFIILFSPLYKLRALLVAQMVKNLPAIQVT